VELNLNEGKIDNAVIETARNEFNRRKAVWVDRWSCKLDFDTIMLRLSNGDLLSDIARDAGVSKQAFQQMYNARFRPLLPGSETGRKRRTIVTVKRWDAKASTDLPKDEELAKIVKMLRSNGFTVHLIPMRDNGKVYRFRKNSILVNGRRCSFYHLTNKYQAPDGKRASSHTNVSRLELMECEFIILASRTPSHAPVDFLIPMQKILDAYGSGESRNVGIRICLDNLPAYHNNAPRLSMWDYKDAWHLIPPLVRVSEG
jgi:hypothetical protein